jgi:hypothetical protein
MAAGAVAAGYVDAAVGAATVVAVEKIAEFTVEIALGLLNTLVLERVTKGWSPRMFVDDLSKLCQVSAKGPNGCP